MTLWRFHDVAARALDALQKFYGALPSPPRDPFGLFVWEVLSVHSTPRKRDAAFGALKRIRALTPDSMSRAPQKKLEESVALAGPYTSSGCARCGPGSDRFRRVAAICREVIRGPLTAARRALRGLPQMGEGGAYRMLLFAADHAVLPVDATRQAVSPDGSATGSRTRLHARRPRSVRNAVVGELRGDAETFRRAFLYLSHHGSATCTERDPHCTVCPLLKDCPYGQKKRDDGRLVERRDSPAERLHVLPDLRVFLAVFFVERRRCRTAGGRPAGRAARSRNPSGDRPAIRDPAAR